MTDKEFTIGQAAQILGVTPKALRHWDDIGVLTPTWRTWSDYRLYTEQDLERGAAIVLYQAAGVKLADIAVLIDDARGAHLSAALREHREGLVAKQTALKRQLESVDQLIAQAEQGESTMDKLAQYFGENMPEYQKEAEERWGDSDEWAQSQARVDNLKDEDWARFKQEQDEFARDLAAAKDSGVQPGSAEALELVERHRASIGQWYECSRARQWVLAQMYTQDKRFSAAYGGNEAYLLSLVEKQAELEGITEPNWG
ncbi:MerR family transcriptional regulator [Corynebacterium lubricantis]|uniref:MerR family transcriptional regulator n=1 Tax=Corynebacterium lubricantis TaxID=541095 RepID=UPI0003687964|nr:MerR family transcriptional regulator [Corynebacterium lubricantis]